MASGPQNFQGFCCIVSRSEVGGVAVVQGEVRGVLGTWVNKLPEFIWFGFSDAIVVILKDYCDTVHFRLRSFKGV